MPIEPSAIRLEAYVPRLLGHVLAGAPHSPSGFRSLRGHGVALIADLSGFTALSERLCARGPDGIEALSQLLNATFGRMVDCIAAHGGDTLRFAGDAPIAIWWGDEAADLQRRVAAAAACARRLQGELDRANGLSMRVGIGVGSLAATTVGGVEGRWELVVSGGAVRAMATAERHCGPGEVVVSPEAAQWLPAGCSAEAPEGFRRVLQAFGAPAVVPVPTQDLPDDVRRTFVPRSLVRRLDAGQDRWLAEMRQVAVLFGSVRGIDPDADDASALLHAAFRGLQTDIYRRGGDVNQFLVDDKGLTLVAAWGLPGTTHEDDARRAMSAALAASNTMREMGLDLRVGVATGRVYSGIRGNDTRREYALIGDTVNLAARLMMASDGRVLCDVATSRRSGLAPASEVQLTLKGRAAPVPTAVYEPTIETAAVPLPVLTEDGGAIIGRGTERGVIDGLLDQHARGVGGVLWIEGEAGIGKSTLVAAAVGRARASGRRVHVRAGDAIGQAEAYLVWRGLLAEIFEVTHTRELVEHLAHRYADDAEIIDRLPLLGPVIGLDLEDTALTRQLGGDVRADATREQVVRILAPLARQHPLILVFDDGHWIDSASWALLRAVTRRLSDVLVIIGSRLLDADAVADGSWVRERATAHLILDGLSDAEVALLACRRVGARTLTADVERFVTTRAGGHPLFAGELVASMAESGVVQVTDGICHVHNEAGNLGDLAFPDTVQGIIRMRIDQLGPGEQLTLKLASVIGQVFDYEVLRDIHALLDSEATLRGQLDNLGRFGFAAVEVPEPKLAYRFHHALIRDVAYGLMLPEQRREVHADVARWIEARSGDAPPWALLAHHWTHTHNESRSLECLERAGAQANEVGAPREADRFYCEALALAERAETVRVDPRRQASWDSGRTKAWIALGDFPRGRLHVERGLARLRRPSPTQNGGWYRRLAVELLRLWTTPLRSMVPSGPRETSDDLQAVELLGRMSQVAFYQRDTLPMIVSGLAAINAAERHKASAAAAEAYTLLGAVMAVLGFETTADRWWQRAAEAPDARWLTAALSGRAFDAINRGRWQAADAYLAEAGALARRMGDRMGLESVLMLDAFRHSYASSPHRGESAGQALLDLMRLRESPHRELWGHLVIAGNRLERRDIQGALGQLASAEPTVGLGDPASLQSYHGMMAECHFRRNDTPLAVTHLEHAEQLIRDYPDLGMGNHHGDGPVVVVSLGLAEADPGQRPRHLQRARRSLDRLRRAGRVAVATRVRARRLEGNYWHVRGHTRRAIRWWRRALAGAEAAALPLERALAHEALGMLPGDGSRAHKAAASVLFEELDIERPVSGRTER